MWLGSCSVVRAVLAGCLSLLHLFRHDLSALALITLLPPLAVVTLDPLCCAWLSSFFEPHRRPSARVRRLTWSACRRCCCCESIQLSPVSHGGRAFAKPHRRAAAAPCAGAGNFSGLRLLDDCCVLRALVSCSLTSALSLSSSSCPAPCAASRRWATRLAVPG